MKRKSKHIYWLLVFVFLMITTSKSAEVRFNAGGLTMGLSVGFSPDVYKLSDSNEALSEQNLYILNRMHQINELYDSSTYGERQVIRDFKYSSNEINAIPVEISFKYSWYGLMIRMGFVYFNSSVDQKSYVLTTGSATQRSTPSSSGSNTLYNDITNNFDDDPSNNEALAIGLRPTYGEPVRFYQFIKLSRYEIPISFGISMFDLGPASFFFGGGMTFYFGNKTRTIHAQPLDKNSSNQSFFQDDIDSFSSTSVGFHIISGAEYRFVNKVGLSIEFNLTFGSTNPINDSVRTGAFTNNSLFHKNNGYDFGGNENAREIINETNFASADAIQIGKGVEKTDSLDFTGWRIMIGFNYHLFRN